MAIPNETPRILHAGTGTRGPFSLSVDGTPISFSDTDHIVVTRFDADGVDTELVEGTDYQLSAESALPDLGDQSRTVTAATLTLKVAQPVLDEDERLLIERATPASQDLAYTQATGFSSRANERALDEMVRTVQQLHHTVSQRGVQLHPLDEDGNIVWPSADDRADTILTFDENGDPLPIPSGDFAVVISGGLLASLNLSDVDSAAASRSNLGLGTMAVQGASNVAITGGSISGVTGVRPQLQANQDYFLNCSDVPSTGQGFAYAAGNDANDGLTRATPWRTPAKADAVFTSLDINKKRLRLYLADAVTTDLIDWYGDLVGQRGDDDFQIIGNETNPSAVLFDKSDASTGITIRDARRCKITGVGGASAMGYGMSIYNDARVWVGEYYGGECGAVQMQAAGGYIRQVGDWDFEGDSAVGQLAEGAGGHIDKSAAYTTAYLDTPAYSDVIIEAAENSAISIHAAIWAGSPTGKKFRIWNSSGLFPASARASIPGTVAGTNEETFTTLTTDTLVVNTLATVPTASPGDNTTKAASTAFVTAAITALKNGVSAAFDTLIEIEVALGLKAPIASPTFTGTPAAPTATGGTNTTQIATTAFVKAAIDVVLGGVSAAFDTLSEIVTELALKAPLASPAFTGNPTAPIASPGDNDTSIATTGFVKAAIDVVLGGVSAAFDTLSEIVTELALKAPLASPALTGNPTAPTATPGDNDTSIATTAFVQAANTALIVTNPTRQILTSGSGTYTTPAGATRLRVRCIGGGGGSNGSGTTPGGSPTGGGATTFSTLTANGGAVGNQSGAAAAGGTASGGDFNLTGGVGGQADGAGGRGAPGGVGVFGGNGSETGTGVIAALAGKTNTGGGAGGAATAAGTINSGGGGAGGYCEAWINAPAATYSYGVGAAGAAGTAGTLGAAGAAGGSGIVIVEEFYDAR